MSRVSRLRAGETIAPIKKSQGHGRLLPTLVLVGIVLMAAWMGNANGGYFVGDWAPVAIILAVLLLITSVVGVFSGKQSWWSVAAGGLFAAYAAWTLASLYWSPNRGDAWLGAGLTILYLLTFWLTVTFIALGASRRWILAASAIGPAIIAAFTLPTLTSRIGELFDNDRLIGSVGYYNGEVAFLLVPFWVAVYLAGSRRVNPILRGALLAGVVLSVAVAVLTQSRGAMVAMAFSIPIFFLFSGQRLRGLLALAPVVAALALTFPGLNDVYLSFINEGDPTAALDRVVPTVWLTAAGAGLYGLLWGIADRRWRPPIGAVRVAGSVALAGGIVVIFVGALAFNDRVEDPGTWAERKWEAFKTDDAAGQEQSRYLSASGSGRYTLWQVAWKDFVSHPVLGVGTHNYEATYYQLREQPGGWVRQPHTLPLEVLAERGAVGGLLFFGFLAACLAAGLWKRFRNLSTEGKAQVGAVTAALAYWFIHSSAEWFWQMPAVTLPAMVYLAMLVTSWSRSENIIATRWPLRLAGAVVAVAAISAIAPLYIASHYLAWSETMNPRTGLETVEKARMFNPVDSRLPQREAELALQSGDWPRVEEAYREAIRLDPEHYAPYALLALFFEERGEPDKALPLYREASDLNPLDEELDRKVAELEKR